MADERPPGDGGPAFPVPELQCWDGMSLRDWFACHAMEALLRHTSYPYADIAQFSFSIADFMLKERDR